LRAIQDEKLRAAVPFLYENSAFYRRRFERLGLVPGDIRDFEDLAAKWPVVDKSEIMADTLEHPPYGTHSAMTEALWAERGWMMLSSSGTNGVPRVFRYSHIDREQCAWANARALYATGIRKGDTVFMMTGYGAHIFAWGMQVALFKMNLPTLPDSGMDAQARASVVLRFRPTILLCTPSYALHLARGIQALGHDPASVGVHTILVGAQPSLSIESTRQRIEELWDARLVEFYGCTEIAPHVGGYSCYALKQGGQVATHLAEDIQIWETVDPDTKRSLRAGARGLTVCTSLNSETSPQLRFLVGDFATFDAGRCACGRTHVRALGLFSGHADDLVNLHGVKRNPTQIEHAMRSIPNSGEEFESVIETDAAGLDTMTVCSEYPDHGSAAEMLCHRLTEDIRSRCEVPAGVEVVPPGTLPKFEFKAKRVKDKRRK
jgi:phenylacetate-CoA ligase